MTPHLTADQLFTLLPTKVPQEDVVRIAVATRDLIPARKPAQGSTYRAAELPERPRVSEFGDYVLTDCGEGPAGYQYLYFSQAKTLAQQWTAVDVWEDQAVEQWPAVLEALRPVKNAAAPIAVQRPSADDPSGKETVYLDRIDYFLAITPATTAVCRIRVELFQGPLPFIGLSYPVPVPGNVSWNFGPLGSGSFTALHPDVRIPRPPGKYQVVADATPGFTDAPYQRDLIFPATRFKTWRPYVFRATPGRVNGVYTLERATIYPPPKPKPVYS